MKKNNTDKNKTFKRLLQVFRPYKVSFIMIVVFAFVAVICNIMGPKFLGEATNLIAAGVASGNGVDFAGLAKILIFLAVLYVGYTIFTYFQQKIAAKVSQNAMKDLRRQVNRKISRLPLNYFDTHTRGDILSRTTTDIERISTTLQQAMTQIISAVITIIGIVVLMLSISGTMTLIALCLLPIILFIISRVVKRSQKYYIGQAKILGDINSYVEEMYGGHEIIKLYNKEADVEKDFNEINNKLFRFGYKAQFASASLFPIITLVSNIGYVAVCILGGVLAAAGGLSVGGIQSFIMYIQQFTQPILQVSNLANVFSQTIAAAERIFELLDEEEMVPEREQLAKIEKTTGRLVFEHVKFGYVPDKILISDLNLTVEPGQKVAIVGPTGAGKTTLVNLIMRFYELNGGSIKIDGVDIRDMSRKDLRSLFGMVLQETWLYSDTIYNNIAYGVKDPVREEIIEACRMANVDRFINTLPEGYDTEVNEEADNISQGQKQLLTIARAFAAKPQILILDEATSSVDTRTEKLIQGAMENLTKGRTSFVIAHRLSTIKDSDIILVLDKGDIIEQGNHEELMAKNGFYTNLYNSQFADEEETV